MPRNGSGTYSLPAGNPVVTGTVIDSTVQNNTTSDIATALTQSIAYDGQTTPTANLPMGGFRHTGVGTSSALTMYARTDQAQNAAFQWLTSVAGTNTITASASITPTAYAAGQVFRFIPANTITGAATINISSLGAKDLKKNQSGGLVALVANDLIAGNVYEIVFDDTGSDQFVVTNVTAYAQGADVASAATINLDTATGDYIHVTGTTTITAITLKQGQERTLVFDAALTFTNGASLLLPGAASITTAAGDTCVVRGEASGVVRVISYTPKLTYLAAVSGSYSYTRKYVRFDTAPTAFDVDGNITEGSFESVGPTGSSATNTYSEMDVMPTNATFVVFMLTLGATVNATTTPIELTFYGRPTGTSGATTGATMIRKIIIQGDAGDVLEDRLLIDVPVDSSRRCDLAWEATGDSAVDISVAYRGFCI